ncbi:MAG: dihydrofolate reductase [Acidobacteriota bacterium]
MQFEASGLVSIIAAVSANRVIGRDNTLPWRLPADLKRFKDLTMGHHLLMGRKTFESIGRPLRGRKLVVITRRCEYVFKGVQVAGSLEQALQLAAGDDEVFIAGGAEIYRRALELADRLYLTRIEHHFDGDTYFPGYDESQWRLISRETHQPDQRNLYPYSFEFYEKVR